MNNGERKNEDVLTTIHIKRKYKSCLLAIAEIDQRSMTQEMDVVMQYIFDRGMSPADVVKMLASKNDI